MFQKRARLHTRRELTLARGLAYEVLSFTPRARSSWCLARHARRWGHDAQCWSYDAPNPAPSRTSDRGRGFRTEAGRTYKRGALTADERVETGRSARDATDKLVHSWDALNVTSATQCGWHKCYFPSQREDEGWLVGQPSKCLRPQCRDAAGQLLPPNQIPGMAPPTRWFPPYSRAWALAEELRAGFGVDHLINI